MRRILFLLALLATMMLVLAALPISALAKPTPIKLKTKLSGEDVVPAVDTPGKGKGKFTYDPVTNTLSFVIRFKNLQGPDLAAHFHMPAASGSNAPPVITIAGGGPGTPATSLGSPYIGSVVLTEEQEGWLLTGLVYVQIHTPAFPPGEVRGQVG